MSSDSVYCWRARRLMASKKLSVFEQMSDGSVAKVFLFTAVIVFEIKRLTLIHMVSAP